MIYQLVQTVDGQMVVSEFDRESIWAGMEIRGFLMTGCLERNPRARIGPRDELIGQPQFSGVYGPMYNGAREGVPVIRYEDRKTYEALSA